MKERIVITQDWLVKDMKAGVVETDKLFICQKVEQVPETFEELKELCKGIKGNKKDCGGAMWFEFPVLNDSTVWLGKALAVDQKGQVGLVEQTWKEDNYAITIFAQHRTPNQMWQIIKSLIGE